MIDLLRFVKNGARNFASRLKKDGWHSALIWLGGHGIPKLTGIPLQRYSRITADIYVGSQIGRAGKKQLEAWGISGSVNMRDEYDDAAHSLALTQYCYLPTVDGHAPTIEQLEHGIAFIQKVLAGGGKVYIHCRSGVGRAPTMAAAYFISQGRNLTETMKLIVRTRPFIEITLEQMELLQRFEQSHSIGSSV